MRSSSTDLRTKAKKGIDKADDTTVKMILAMLDVHEKEEELEEATFENQMKRRFDDFENGKIVPLSLDELENRVRKSYKKHVQSGK